MGKTKPVAIEKRLADIEARLSKSEKQVTKLKKKLAEINSRTSGQVVYGYNKSLRMMMVTEWSIANGKTVDLPWDETNYCCDVDFFTPATEEEYLEFKKGEVAV